ncbi:unnamed protein product [Rotaria sp. Silwood2]|nr:unnamed protein product [Rotaria sp. Silwood2]CAF4612260.1 unnamed protein product [Rotaria sp. Silwood2]
MTQLKNVDCLAVTTDLWSDRKLNSYICLTGHFLNGDSKLISTVLSFTSFRERHTGEQIGYTIKKALKRLQVYEKTRTITCDGASNMRKSFDLLIPKRVQCLGHKLHLIVCNGLCLWVKDAQVAETPASDEEDGDGDENIDIVSSIINDSVESMSTNDIDDTSSDETSIDDSEDSSDDEDSDSDDDSTKISEVVIDNWEEGVVEDTSLITCLEQYTTNQAIEKCRGLVKTINKSSILSNFFDHQKIEPKLKNTLIIDCKSRWSSTHRLIQSILLHKSIINRLYAEKYDLHLSKKQQMKLLKFELNREEWIILESVEEVLNAFFEATKLISGKKYCTIGIAFFAVANLKEHLEERSSNSQVDNLKDLLLLQLKNYFDNDFDQYELLKQHAFYDPLGFGSMDRGDRTSIEREIKSLHKESITSSTNSYSLNTASTTTIEHQSKPNSIQRFLSSVGKRQTSIDKSNTVLSIANELALYRSLAMQEYINIVQHSKEHDPFGFWNIHGSQLKFLHSLARKHLIVPATSVPSESVFSTAAFLGRKERTRLSSQNLATLVFLKDKMNEEIV